MTGETPGSAGDLVRLIKSEWEARAQSKDREFFVASHPGWEREDAREHQAASDAAMFLTALKPEAISAADLLEVGCGSGRIAFHLAPRVRSYTGIDIAPTMIAVARDRCRALSNARFFESDGATIPAAARDRAYTLALAAAVFIHCPKSVCDALGAAVMGQLAPGGEFRVQLRADSSDSEGISGNGAAGVVAVATEVESIVTPEQSAMITGTNYAGHAFTYREAQAWAEGLGDARIHRFDPLFIYAVILARGSR